MPGKWQVAREGGSADALLGRVTKAGQWFKAADLGAQSGET